MKVRKMVSSLTLFFIAAMLYQISGADESTEGELVWVGNETKRIVEVGSLVELPCHVKVPTSTNVLWVKVGDDGSEIIAHDDKLISENPRFSISYNSTEGLSLLTIENIISKDSGRYECQVPTLNTKINAAVEIIVVGDSNNSTSLNEDDRTSNSSNSSSMSPDDTLLQSEGYSFTPSVFLVSILFLFSSLLNVIVSV